MTAEVSRLVSGTKRTPIKRAAKKAMLILRAFLPFLFNSSIHGSGLGGLVIWTHLRIHRVGNSILQGTRIKDDFGKNMYYNIKDLV